jgi:ABC-type phosphate transport system permease subunit
MKIQLQKFFIVCLIILTILSPGLFVFSIIWQQHLELDQSLRIDHFNSSDNSSISIIDLFQQPNIILFIQWLLFAMPISLGIILFLQGKYTNHRVNSHQQNIEMLERLYQQSLKK